MVYAIRYSVFGIRYTSIATYSVLFADVMEFSNEDNSAFLLPSDAKEANVRRNIVNKS